MRRVFPSVLAVVLTFAALTSVVQAAPDKQPAKKPERWVQLFNGKDLTGWKVKIRHEELGQDPKKTFRVEDGYLSVGYENYGDFENQFGHIFYDQDFSNYRLRVEYRFLGEQSKGGPGWAFRNSGIMVHGQPPETMAKDQDFPASIEVQLLGGSGKGERTTSNLCTPGTNVVMGGKLKTQHCILSRSKTYHGDQWVTAELLVEGNRIQHISGGEVVLEYTDPQLDPRDGSAKRLLDAGYPRMLRRGTISLQSESHPVQFRKVEILELDPPKSEGWVDLLEGGDLSKHWHTKGNWVLGKDGVVSLVPRKGEQGWSRFDAYLWLKEHDFADFEIDFDYRLKERSNSGFYFHVGDKKDPVRQGIEVQIYDTPSRGKKPKLNDHDSGGIIPGIPPIANAARPAGEWNQFHIVSRGKDLTVWLNGIVVNRISLDHPKIKDRPATGAIGFQDHALPLELRRLRIRKL